MSSRRNRLFNGYRREFMDERGSDRSFESMDLARWALATGRVKRAAQHAQELVERQLAREFAEAMREDYTRDAQGRTVREMHAARIGGRVRWHSRNAGSRGFLETAVKQRRDQIVGDCRHLKADVDSLNENRWPNNPIQLPLDFTNDVAEFEAAEGEVKGN